MFKKIVVSILAFALLLSTVQGNLFAKDGNPAQNKKEPLQYLVKFKDADQGKKKNNNKKIKKQFKNANLVSYELTEEELVELYQDQNVEYVEEDYPVQVMADFIGPNLDQINVPAVQREPGLAGQGVKVAVLDTGIDAQSSELRIKDGISFVESEPSYLDENGHGTHIAGTLAAVKDDQGMLGIVPEVDLYAVKVLNREGVGSYSNVIRALEWAVENNIDIVSMSFSGKHYSRALEEAVEEAHKNNILLVAAAGNGGLSIADFPARFPSVVSVGAVDEHNQITGFSNTGKVDLVAPGVNITSLSLEGEYVQMSGTSMAVPHVTGVAAMVKQAFPELNNKQIYNRLLIGSTPLGEFQTYGSGIIDAWKTVNANDVTINLDKDDTSSSRPA